MIVVQFGLLTLLHRVESKITPHNGIEPRALQIREAFCHLDFLAFGDTVDSFNYEYATLNMVHKKE